MSHQWTHSDFQSVKESRRFEGQKGLYFLLAKRVHDNWPICKIRTWCVFRLLMDPRVRSGRAPWPQPCPCCSRWRAAPPTSAASTPARRSSSSWCSRRGSSAAPSAWPSRWWRAPSGRVDLLLPVTTDTQAARPPFLFLQHFRTLSMINVCDRTDWKYDKETCQEHLNTRRSFIIILSVCLFVCRVEVREKNRPSLTF